MSTISEQRVGEWPSLRLGLAGAAALAALVLAGWGIEAAAKDGPSRLELTERCLRREKLLDVRPVERDAIAAEASGGALTTVVEGNRVHVLVASSRSEAERLAGEYQRVGGPLIGRLEIRGANVQLWTGPASPTQRQTLFDCTY